MFPAARDLFLAVLIPHTTVSNAHPPLGMAGWRWWKLVGYAPLVTRTAMLVIAAFGTSGRVSAGRTCRQHDSRGRIHAAVSCSSARALSRRWTWQPQGFRSGASRPMSRSIRLNDALVRSCRTGERNCDPRSGACRVGDHRHVCTPEPAAKTVWMEGADRESRASSVRRIASLLISAFATRTLVWLPLRAHWIRLR